MFALEWINRIIFTGYLIYVNDHVLNDTNLITHTFHDNNTIIPTLIQPIKPTKSGSPGLIGIGCVHSGTSTMQKVLCNTFQDMNRAKKFEFGYWNDKRARLKKAYMYNPSATIISSTIHDDIITLSNWRIDINKSLQLYPYKGWLQNWSPSFVRNRDKFLYGKATSHYMHPPTATMFAYLAHQYKWKFFIHLRDPIKRMWSVLQHWHRYPTNNPKLIRSEAEKELFSYYNNNKFLKNIAESMSNESVSNDELIGLWYQAYWKWMHGDKNAMRPAQEWWSSLYCIPIMYWLKEFDHVGIETTGKYFRIIQSKYITKDVGNAVKLVYCWFKYDIDDTEQCKMVLGKNLRMNTNVHEASGHIWSVEMSWSARSKLIEIFEGGIKRLDDIIGERNIVLGEWNSWLKQYDLEKEMKHDDNVIVDHPERNNKKGGAVKRPRPKSL